MFVTPTATLCVIRPSRGHDVPEAILGADYDGRMIHDGWTGCWNGSSRIPATARFKSTWLDIAMRS